MLPNLQIAFHGLEPSDAVKTRVRNRFQEMQQYFADIVSCRVAVEKLHSRHTQGNLFHIRVTLRVPGSEIVVGRAPELHGAHEDLYVALRDSFNAVQRQLEDYVRRRRPKTATRASEGATHGRITKILHDDGGYGFLETPDGREIYFHSRSVVNGAFDSLRVGYEVRYDEENGEEGPQASSVRPIGKWGKHGTHAA